MRQRIVAKIFSIETANIEKKKFCSGQPAYAERRLRQGFFRGLYAVPVLKRMRYAALLASVQTT